MINIFKKKARPQPRWEGGTFPTIVSESPLSRPAAPSVDPDDRNDFLGRPSEEGLDRSPEDRMVLPGEPRWGRIRDADTAPDRAQGAGLAQGADLAQGTSEGAPQTRIEATAMEGEAPADQRPMSVDGLDSGRLANSWMARPDNTSEEMLLGHDDADDLPKFRHPPSEVGDIAGPLAEKALGRAAMELWQAFTPTQPKHWGPLFAGRREIVQRIITAIEEDRANIILYGQRGVGKTSVANMIAAAAENAGYLVIRCACSSHITYEEIFRTLMRSIPTDLIERWVRVELGKSQNFEELLPSKSFGPSEAALALGYLKLNHVIFILDEFDRIDDENLTTALAETIKNLSDLSARVTFFVLGVAEDVGGLLGSHQSIQRHLIGFRLPLMSQHELRSLIEMGEQKSGLSFEPEVVKAIVSLSKGLPYYAQLLCLHAGRRALERRSLRVSIDDFRGSLQDVLNEADPLVIRAFHRAIQGGKRKHVEAVLVEAARAKFDKYGAFSATDMLKGMKGDEGKEPATLMAHQVLSKLCDTKEDAIFRKHNDTFGDTKYVFVNQTMRQYILVRKVCEAGLTGEGDDDPFI